MLSRFVQAVTISVRRRARRVGRSIKHLLRPARTAAALAGAASLDAVRPRSALMAENALLRQQILVLRRAAPPRPRLHREDRLILVVLARLTRAWREALLVVQPDTLLRWHRGLFTLLWRRRSRPNGWPRRLDAEVVDLIQAMAKANVLWGGGQTWATFLRNHAPDIWACDFLQLYDVWFRRLFAFVIITHGSREVVHVNVTRTPSDAWVAQQLREATPYDEAPRRLIRDNDGKFGRHFADGADGAHIDVVRIPRVPS